ncbi:MAG TPA: N-acetylmuramoyl-L-alanine amidase [Fimbriimonadaceae bacterium]|jgi:N-acetylmuramoyl-L-alanine amidase
MKKILTLILTLSPLLCLAQTICIDPGHPSENGVGTHGKHVTELHAAWVVSLKLQKILEADGYKVVLTKSSEHEVVRNIRRAEVANEANAALSVRLHCDAGTKPGIAVYYPAKQGHVNDKTGPSEEVIKGSHKAGVIFHKALIQSLDGALQDRGLLTDSETYIGGKQGGALTGSIYSTVPVVLVEMAVLQNEHDDLFISTEDGQNTVAKALAAGVEAAVPRKN